MGTIKNAEFKKIYLRGKFKKHINNKCDKAKNNECDLLGIAYLFGEWGFHHMLKLGAMIKEIMGEKG
jgi:hypothetical protein